MPAQAKLLLITPICFIVVFLLAPLISLLSVLLKDPASALRFLVIKIPPDGEFFRVHELPETKIITFTGLDFGPIVNTLLLGATVSLVTTSLALFSATACLRIRGWPRLLLGYVIPLSASLPTPFISAYAVTHLFHRDFGLLSRAVEYFAGYRITFEGISGVLVYQLLSFYPLSHLIVTSYVDLIEKDLLEAASNLGARGLKVVKDVVIPLCRPVVIVCGTLAFVLSIEDLAGPVAFSRYNSARNLMAYIAYYDFLSEYGFTVSPRSVTYVIILSTLAAAMFAAFWRNLKAYRYPVVSTRVAVVDLGTVGTLMVALSLILLSLSLLPKAMTIAYSITEGWYGSVRPQKLTLSNYVEALGNTYYLRSLMNTVVYSSLSVLIITVVASMATYASLRLETRVSSMLEALIALPIVIPGIAVGIGYFTTFRELFKSLPPLDPMTNPAPYLVVAYAARRVTYAARPLSAALQKVSKNMEEQAMNLGARHGYVIRTVTLPLVYNAFVAAVALASVYTSTELSVSLVLTGGYGVSSSHPAPVVTVIMNMLTYNPASIHTASALLVLSVAVSTAISVALTTMLLKVVSGLRWKSLLGSL